MACNPPLNFVPNGAPGSALPPPLDPNDVPNFIPSPTFSQTACTLLGADLCAAMDPISAIDELPALADEVDALALAADENLDGILLALDSLDGNAAVQTASDTFGSDQGGIDNLVAQVDPSALPALADIPLIDPSGQAQTILGGSPITGGAPNAGDPAYVLHVPLSRSAALAGAPTIDGLDGANPPFVGVQGVQRGGDGENRALWYAYVEIDPASSGEFTATLQWHGTVSITGITGQMQVAQPFSVAVQ